MIIRQARSADFTHVETFVWQAIFPAFDREGLTAAQRAENDALVEGIRGRLELALADGNTAVFVALKPTSKSLVGFVIADASPRAYAEIPLLIVGRAHWGKGVADKLMAEATNYIGTDRAVSAAIRYYNGRALAFFAKHDFVDTGETTGDFAIARKLLLREAYEVAPTTRSGAVIADDLADFPTGADEPVPVYEALPDHSLTVEDTPIFETGTNALAAEELSESMFEESHLSDKQLTELEAFIARARAKKGIIAPPKDDRPVYTPPPVPKTLARRPKQSVASTRDTLPAPERAVRTPSFDREKIAFEVDYGTAKATPTDNKSAVKSASFEFAFESAAANEATDIIDTSKAAKRPGKSETVRRKTVSEPKTKSCPDCQTELPVAARFCFSCGYPQPAPGESTTSASTSEPEDVLELGSLDEPSPEPVTITKSPPRQEIPDRTGPIYQLSELKSGFRAYLDERLVAYFSQRKLAKFHDILVQDIAFQQMRDSMLASLLTWLNTAEDGQSEKQLRRDNTFADLSEYFIVETASAAHGRILPQKLLRHQRVNWATVDLFQLVMDYLAFDEESEVVYTDFVTMPARALRNATNAFLSAGKDERIFFVCDQSLLSQAKNGFAVTDSGLYWKSVLQPAGVVMFNELQKVRLKEGYLDLDGQFFNAGGTLNLKLAVLLDKLRRMG